MRSRWPVPYRWRTLGSIVLGALLVMTCLGALPGGASAGHASAAAPLATPALPAPPAQGSVLAVVRADGADLYDAQGNLIASLPAGATLDVTGRTADSQWLYAAARDGTEGWVSPRTLLVYGITRLPVRGSFAGPAKSTGASATPVPAWGVTPATSGLTPGGTDGATGGLAAAAGAPTTGGGSAKPAKAGSPATATPLAAGRDPAHALPVPDGPQALAKGRRIWYAYRYAGDNSQVTIDLRADPAGSASFAVWSPEDVRRWAVDKEEHPTGRGTPNRLFDGNLVWTGNSKEPNTYYVSIDQAGPAPATFTLRVAGSGVSPLAPAGPAAASTALGPVAAVISGTAALNVRSGPGANFAVIDTLAPGAAVNAVARDETGEWVQISGPGRAGARGTAWVSAHYLAPQGAPPGAMKTLPLPSAPDAPAKLWAEPAGKLAFQDRSGGSIYIHDFGTGAPRKLTDGADPAITRDGRTVAFWRDTGQQGLYTIGSDGTGERAILTRGELLRSPSWSPDGERLVFTHVVGQDHCRDASYGICLPDRFPYSYTLPLALRDVWGLASIDRNGQNYHDVPAAHNAVEPSWAERGIAYGAWGIQLTRDDTGASANQRVLGEYRYQDPALQPGGDRIIYQSQEKDHWEIFTVNADGSGRTALTRPESALVDRLPNNVAPAWSPDGQHIVFLSDRTGDWRLWVMNADGSNQRPLPIDVPIEYNYQAEQVVSWGK